MQMNTLVNLLEESREESRNFREKLKKGNQWELSAQLQEISTENSELKQKVAEFSVNFRFHFFFHFFPRMK